MTLNITILTANVIYQSADFRLWDPARDEVITDSSNKSVSIRMDEWEGALTYTGIGRWGDRDTSEWITEWLTGVGNVSFTDLQELLRAKETPGSDRSLEARENAGPIRSS